MFYTIKNMANDYNQPFLICDTVADVSTVPTSYAPGSKILVVSNGDKYILNNNHSWIKQPGGGGSGSSIPEHGVFFIDYNGSIVTAWASNEVASKTALPDNPTHDGLVAQGWNWSLANIKSYIANYQSANVYVGQMYKTASGLTEIDITVTKATDKTVTCNMVGNKNWGDGTEDNLTEHTYADYGDYTITCDGTTIPAGNIDDGVGGLFGSIEDNMNSYWCTAIRIGENVTSIGEQAFSACDSLTNITIPWGVTNIGGYAFFDCRSLIDITIPQSVTNIEESAFDSCYSLTDITLPQDIENIGGYAFNSCYSLTDITLPQSITNIGEYTFNNCNSLTDITLPRGIENIGEGSFISCHALTRYDFTSMTNVPTLDEDAFNNINGICKIVVPDALYDDWIVATNWSSLTDYIYKASEV